MRQTSACRKLVGMPVILAAVLCLVLSQACLAQVLPSLEGDDEDKQPSGLIEATEEDLPSDEEIQNRIQSIFANLENLQQVSISVNDGVVVLSGTVDDQESMERARNLAQRVAGTVIVLNNIERNRSLAARLNSSLNGIASGFRDLVGAAPLLLLALLVVGLALFIARLLGRAEWLYQRVSGNWFIRDLLRQAVQGIVIFAGVVLALQLLDATALLGSVVGALGILGLAVGFATRETVENYIASILLSLRQPFRHDEYIDVDGIEGRVLRLTPRATVLMSLEGNHLRIPNSKVFKATITNYSRNPLRRFEFQVGVDTEIELNRPRELAVQTLGKIPGILQSPPPLCLVEALGDSSVILKIQAWIDQRETDYQKIRSEAQRLVKEAFDTAGIVMPEPIYNINLRRPRKPAGQPSDASGPAPAAPEEKAGDTSRDETLDRQVQEEKSQHAEEDLLSRSAPVE